MSNTFIEDNPIIIEGNSITFNNLYTGAKTERLFDMTSFKLHEQLKNMDYNKEYNATGKVTCPEIENYKMIPFAYMYYYFVAINGKIPTPNELSEQYLKVFCEKNLDGTYKFKNKYLLDKKNLNFDKNSLVARIMRAYNSYNRELELLINLKEKFKNKAIVKYDSIADLCCGVDIIVKTKSNEEYGLATYVGTKRSKSYKVKKNTLRHDYSKLNMIDVIAYMSGDDKNVTKYGDIFVYNKSVVNDIYEKIA